MDDRSRQRRFRFGLRTLLLCVTICCLVLGWQLQIVRERRALLEELKAIPHCGVETAAVYAERFPAGTPAVGVATIPTWRPWLGDEAIQEIWITPWLQPLSEEEMARIRRVFPEAQLVEVQPEPCHPGCFPRGSMVLTSNGPRRIETIRVGDGIVTLDSAGEGGTATVEAIFRTKNQLWQIETEGGLLVTTQTQPLAIDLERSKRGGELKAGDEVLTFVDGAIRPVRVLRVQATGRSSEVFNLVLGEPRLFLVNGYVAVSKPPKPTEDQARERD